jgi:type IV pilus assembly protein PilB
MRLARLDHEFYEKAPRSQLGTLLLEAGLLSHENLDRALEERVPGELLGEALVRLRFCFADDIARVLAKQAGVDFVDLDVTSVERSAAKLLTREQAEDLHALPVRFHTNGEVSVAVADPSDTTLLSKLKLATGQPVRLLVATPSALRTALDRVYPRS